MNELFKWCSLLSYLIGVAEIAGVAMCYSLADSFMIIDNVLFKDRCN